MGRRTLAPRTRRALTAVSTDVDEIGVEAAASTTAIADLTCVPTLAYATGLRTLIIEWNIPPADNLGMTPADWVVTVNGSAKTTFGVACEDTKVSLELTADAFYPQSRLPEGSYSIVVAYDGTDATFVDQVGAGRQIAAFTAAASKAAFPRFDLAVFTGDSGSGGLTGLVPAPAAGDAAAGKYLKADGTWAVAGGGSGDSISVNGSAATDADFDDATPAAGAGDLNIKWQKDAGSPNNISAYVDVSALEPLVNARNLANAMQTALKTSDQTAIGTAYADVSGLGFSVSANKAYAFHYYLICDSDATTTGIDVAVNGPASPTDIHYEQVYWTSATARTERGATAYDNNTASTASNGTARKIFEVYGVLRNGANAGTLIPRAKREAVGSGPNVRAGSWGQLIPLD